MASKHQALIPFCRSEKQKRVLKACVDQGSQSKAAKLIGVDRRGLDRIVKSVERYAASQGYSPEHDMTHAAPDGFHVKGVSTLYKDGEVSLQWVKTNQDAANKLELIKKACESSLSELTPLKKVKAPRNARSDLMAFYPMGDPHIGMYAWAEEAGQDFDAETAREQLCGAVDRLVSIAPEAETAVILNLGDFFHSDNMEGRTRRSGNVLDVDTRWARVLDIGIDAMTRIIRRALEKHKRVIVRNNIGNHDEHSSIMLAIALRAFFRKNNRVEIDTSPNPFWYIRHGKNLVGSTHGDRTKPADLPGVMASDRASDWGDTLYRYWYTGHIHHTSKHEFRGCTVESFRTLAASDAWHHGKGYRSGRDMRCIVLHNEFGETEMHRVGIEQL